MTSRQTMFGMMQSVDTCPNCGGEGKVIKEKCPACFGAGYKQIRKKVSVDIPAGIDDRNRIRVAGEGEPGRNGGPRGDLLVDVRVIPSTEFQRDGLNIYNTTYISFAQAALGGDVRVNTIYGDVKITVKPGTQTGARIRLRGKGMPNVHNSQEIGNQETTLVVQVPKHLNSEQKELIRRFDEISGNTLKEFSQEVSDEKGRKKFFKK